MMSRLTGRCGSPYHCRTVSLKSLFQEYPVSHGFTLVETKETEMTSPVVTRLNKHLVRPGFVLNCRHSCSFINNSEHVSFIISNLVGELLLTNLSPTYVIGAGSIGLFIQYLLQPIVSSVLVARPASCEKLNQSPLRLTGAVESSRQIRCQPWATLTTHESPATLIIATKAHEVAEILQLIPSHFASGSTLILCQNGIGIFEAAKQQLPDFSILRLHCWMGIQRRALDHIHIAGIYKFDLAGEPQSAPLLAQWHTVLGQIPIPTTLGTNPPYAEWQKALWNITVNGLCSIVDAPNGAILDFPELRTVADAIMTETVTVAHRAGIPLTQADITAVFDSLEKTRTNINATLQDLRAGRHPELEFFNQAVVETATRFGCPAPVNTLVVQLVNYLEKTQQRKEL